MIRLINVVIVITLSSAFATGIYWWQKSPANQAIKKNLDVKNSSVEEILRLYWEASLRGDADTVMQLSSVPPEDFLQDCVGANKVSETDSNIHPIPLDASNNENGTSIQRNDGIQITNPFTNNVIPGPVNTTSEYIYMRKVSFDRVKIAENKIYQQEAILEVHTSDLSGNFSDSLKHIFFLRNNGQGWKIISVGNKDVLLSISKQINYAIPRPVCDEK